MKFYPAAEQIQARGGTLHLAARVQAFHQDPHQGTWQLEVRGSLERHGPYQYLISSAPLSSVICSIVPGLPAETLEAISNLSYRDFMLVTLILNIPSTFPDQWRYIHDPDLKVGRIHFSKTDRPLCSMVPAAAATEWNTSASKTMRSEANLILISLHLLAKDWRSSDWSIPEMLLTAVLSGNRKIIPFTTSTTNAELITSKPPSPPIAPGSIRWGATACIATTVKTTS